MGHMSLSNPSSGCDDLGVASSHGLDKGGHATLLTSIYDLFDVSASIDHVDLCQILREDLGDVLKHPDAKSDDVALLFRGGAILWDRGTRLAYDSMHNDWVRVGRSPTEFTVGVMLPPTARELHGIGFWSIVDEILVESTSNPDDAILLALRAGDKDLVAEHLVAEHLVAERPVAERLVKSDCGNHRVGP
jgi:hypothetical protein